MDNKISNLVDLFSEVVHSSRSKCIALSGGLDSTILAYFFKKNTRAIVVICKDFQSSDLLYSQYAAKKLGLDLSIKYVSTEELMEAIEKTIRILKNFNDIEIRNSVVLYFAIKHAKELGFKIITTGDGADELFAGYNFLLMKNPDELQKKLERMWKTMHFPSQKIGKSLGVKIESPYLDKKIVNFAKLIPLNLKINEKEGKKYGKWILRKTFENLIPKKIAWRAKSPMQDGAGTNNLTQFFETTISDQTFDKTKTLILKRDRVKIRTKESLYYYQLYKRFFKFKGASKKSKNLCPYCKSKKLRGSNFCRTCGGFPI